MGTRTRFAAPLGRSVCILTVLTAAIVLGVLGLVGAALWRRPFTNGWEVFGLSVAALLLPVTGLFAVRGYEVVPDAVLIRRPGWTSRIPLAGLTGVEADPQVFRGVMCRVGNGGFLGFIGWFWSRRLGWFRAWVTDPARCVRLRFRDRCVVLSPDDPEAFLRALQLRRGWER